MHSLAAPIRTIAAVTVLAFGVNAGIASASAKTESNPKSKWHHVGGPHWRHWTPGTRHWTPGAGWTHRDDWKRPAHRHHAKKTPNVRKYPKATSKPAAVAAAATDAQPDGIPGNWNLILDSQFDSSSLDTNIWRAGYWGTGVTKPVNGLEDDCYSSSNVDPTSGGLDLSVTHRSSTCEGRTYPWTGAIVDTDPSDGRGHGGFQYTYGVLEARVYVPAASSGQIANWPAVWAVVPTTQSVYGEDDVLEGVDGFADWHYHNATGGAPGGSDTRLTPGWHTFASDWQPGSITYYYDGAQVGRVATGIVGEPMYILLDDTVDSQNLNLATASTMKVQYVRVWQQS